MKKILATAVTFGVLGAGAGGTLVADKAINPYIDQGSHYELPVVSDIPQGERVEIAKDRAEMTLKGWNDEYAIKIAPQIPSASLLGGTGAVDRTFNKPATRELFSKKIQFREGGVAAFIEPKTGTENEFDIDFILHSKPDTNVFEYKIEGAEDFVFWYQPELTAEEIANGDERPENVVGSYAVYHKTKANHEVSGTNYATGKAFHIYRPKAIDANGGETWAGLSYANGVLSVTIPQKWLDEAVYPVVVDPTFGYTTVGASQANSTLSGDLGATKYTLSEDGNISTVSAYHVGTGDGNIESSIYDDDGASAYPGTRKAVSNQVSFNSVENDWVVMTITVSLTPGDWYLNRTPDASFTYAFDAGASNQYRSLVGSFYGAQPDPFTAGATGFSRKTSIYATYTASDGVPTNEESQIMWWN